MAPWTVADILMPDGYHKASLAAHARAGITLSASSGPEWRSILLRRYTAPAVVERVALPASADQLLVLVTEGSFDIESWNGRRWQGARYRAGSLGMTAPGHETVLRWRGEAPHESLHLHLPATSLRRVAADLSGMDPSRLRLPNELAYHDPLVAGVMLGLSDALRSGAPDLYAEASRELLAAHILLRHTALRPRAPVPAPEGRLRRLDDFMRAHLSRPLTPAELAEVAGMSGFHLLRTFRRVHGETPIRRLTRLRMEAARRHLEAGHEPVSAIAFLCGYDNPSHFATAFRRITGVSPTAYRRGRR
ncbi:AraC family transcriptional regulator [Muricoccus pecuniae]|uniref:AraC family transcriptional regulator n=1 Tax=Muricoccus pecuniae TaxID=693023 RepID=A0A840YNB8_9PROT|nr:AraC family transcriptional regulator [Roseomonas pecuniae]MBB5696424.1 AraC family transcriptional regulator [Roseomonas pecuniae]